MKEKERVDIYEEDLFLRTFILFAQTIRVVGKYMDAHLNKHAGLSDAKFIVLMVIFYRREASVTATEIARWTDTEPHNITMLINRMTNDGLLRSSRDEKDRRFLNIALTDKGRETLLAAMPVARQVLDRVMTSIGAEDALTLERILKVIRQNAYDGLGSLGT